MKLSDSNLHAKVFCRENGARVIIVLTTRERQAEGSRRIQSCALLVQLLLPTVLYLPAYHYCFYFCCDGITQSPMLCAGKMSTFAYFATSHIMCIGISLYLNSLLSYPIRMK